MNERDVFIEALQKESRVQRQGYLDEACGGDETLKKQVESLLAVHERVGSFLQEPVFCRVDATGDVDEQPVLAQLAATACLESDTPQSKENSHRAGPAEEK